MFIPQKKLIVACLVNIMLALAVHQPAEAVPSTVGDFSAAATLIDFDTLAGGSDILSGEVITNQYAGQGVMFDNPTFTTRANAYPLGSWLVDNSKPNVAFIRQGGGNEGNNVPPQELIFSVPVTMVGMYFATSFDADVTLSVYNGVNLLESLTLIGANLGSTAEVLEGFIGLAENSLITMATITSHSTNTGASFNLSIDDVRFERSVPEPSSFLLLGFGLAGVGLLRKRRIQ
jgi:hypothetical protein